MASKADIFNLALNALLLQRRIINADTDPSNEANVLRANFPNAFKSALADLDLDGTSSVVTLSVVSSTYPTPQWQFAYLYPADCAFLRRIRSSVDVDNRFSHIGKRVAMVGVQKCILTNEESAVAEYISTTLAPEALSESAALAVALRLAWMSAPLITGKGAKELRDSLKEDFILAKAEAQQLDARENFNFVDEDVDSEFVAVRTS